MIAKCIFQFKNSIPDAIFCRYTTLSVAIDCYTQLLTNKIDVLLPLSLTNLLSISLDTATAKVFLVNIAWSVSTPIWSITRS